MGWRCEIGGDGDVDLIGEVGVVVFEVGMEVMVKVVMDVKKEEEFA